MKNYFFLILTGICIASCGDNAANNAKSGSDTSISDTGAAVNQLTPGLNASDTSAVQSKGTDKIPSRTGTTGQGNTTVTGTATGSPTGRKDSTK